MIRPKNSNKSSVAGVLFSDDCKKVLLIKRRDVSIWVLPGGGVDPGETAEAAMIREFFEETGLVVTVKRHVALYTPINKLSNDSYVFECALVKGEPTKGNETQAIDFFPLEKLPKPIFFLHKAWIEEATLSLAEVINKPLSQITYFNLVKYFLCHPVQVLRLILSRCGFPFNTQS